MFLYITGCLVDSSLYEERLRLVEDADDDGVNILDGDCDDSNNTIYPLADEDCDGVDNDCDGLVDDEDDDVLATLWFRDDDGDGYGLTEDSFYACVEPENAADVDGDCDDTQPEANPGETEVCDDGIDNDCDGDWSTCRWDGEVSTFQNAETYIFGDAGDVLGLFPRQGIDYAGNGILEAVVESEYDSDFCGLRFDGTDSNECAFTIASTQDAIYTVVEPIAEIDLMGGSAYLVSGVDGISVLSGVLEGDVIADESDDFFIPNNEGYRVYAVDAADQTGDGLTDIVLAGSISGEVTWLFLDLQRSDSYEIDELQFAEIWSGKGSLPEGLPYGGTQTGDLNGDGLVDFLIGDPTDTTNGDFTGAAFFFEGPIEGSLTYDDADSVLPGGNDQDYFGLLMSVAGDTDGDGYLEVLVSAPFRDTKNASSGSVFLVEGIPKSGAALSEVSVEIYGESSLDMAAMIPWQGHGGDVDGDGNSDLVIGAFSDQTSSGDGIVHLLYGPISGNVSLADSDARFTGPSGSQAGHVNIVGDTNGDGFDDILIGAPYDSTAGEEAGAVYLILGGGM